MIIIDTMILDLILISLPLTTYLLYTAYTKTFNQKENDLLITVIVFTILYLLFKYSHPLYKGMPFIIINIPLIIAYIKKSQSSILATSVIMIIYYYNFYKNLFFVIALEYIIYYLINLKTSKTKNFLIIFSILKCLITIILLKSLNALYLMHIIINIIECLYLYISSRIIICLLKKTEDILKLHMNIKEIKQNSQIHTSLFRITHEIKNPIAVCKGYLDMFDGENIKQVKKYIPILKEEIDRTLLLLEDFLAMNKVKINKEIIDINLLIEEVTSTIKILCNKNNIKLDTKIIDDDIYIKADYNRLTQVFINLLKNSIEAIEKNKNGKILITEKIDDKNIIIAIKDNGKGMNQELLAKIKEPFYTTKPKGTGLGVSLSEEIINAHSGTINYCSKENEYTEVTIKLPVEEY